MGLGLALQSSHHMNASPPPPPPSHVALVPFPVPPPASQTEYVRAPTLWHSQGVTGTSSSSSLHVFAGGLIALGGREIPCVCHMEGSNLEMSTGWEVANTGNLVETANTQPQNIAVDMLDQQKYGGFVGGYMPSSSVYQPQGDVDVFSESPVPLCIMPPVSVPNSGGLQYFGVECQEALLDRRTVDTDGNVGASGCPLNKRLRSLIYPVTNCHDQVDKQSRKDNHVSPYANSVDQRPCEENYSITHYDPPVAVAGRGSNEASSSSAVENRLRRVKISQAIKALEESTPQFGKRTRESVLDNVIDYVKYLKLQITALSQCRLGGEPIYQPLVHLEGFGHYLVHQQRPREPLEEVVGHLMDSNMPLAIDLLESKGLELLPTSSADRIVKASADKFI